MKMADNQDNKTDEAGEVATLKAQVAQLEADLAEAHDGSHSQAGRIAELEEENSGLKRSLAAQRGATTKARASVAALEAAAKPRKIGAMKLEKDDDGNDIAPYTPDELLELIKDAETVEVAFSDGKNEVKGLGARQVSGEAWAKTVSGVKLTVGADDFMISGPGEGQRPFAISGYALLLDGEQVAYAPRHEQIQIGAGQRFNLSDDVVF